MSDHKVSAMSRIVLDLPADDGKLLERIVAQRNAELADEGLAISAGAVLRGLIRREARRRGLFFQGPPMPAMLATAQDDDPPVPRHDTGVPRTMPEALALPIPLPPVPPPGEPTLYTESDSNGLLNEYPSHMTLDDDEFASAPSPESILRG